MTRAARGLRQRYSSRPLRQPTIIVAKQYSRRAETRVSLDRLAELVRSRALIRRLLLTESSRCHAAVRKMTFSRSVFAEFRPTRRCLSDTLCTTHSFPLQRNNDAREVSGKGAFVVINVISSSTRWQEVRAPSRLSRKSAFIA